jgi:UDP-GlcNAc:undecaprenyl-phosphate/decaprenyl-phosphate GlcNAc-1-phosphate transferase
MKELMFPGLIFLVVLPLIISIVMINTLIPIAKRIGLVDHPNDRKHHRNSIPLVGGVAILIAIAISILFLNVSLLPYRSLFIGSGILVIVGVLDDMQDISPKVRLLMQFLAATSLLYPGNLVLHSLGDIFTTGDNIHINSFLAIIVTLLAVIGMINAMNMLDGQDGLLGGIALIQLGWLAVLSYFAHALESLSLLLITCGALLGFLFFNYRSPWLKQAVVFMGDAGSTLMGFICAWFAIYLSQTVHTSPVVRPVVFLWVLALPLCDIIGAMIRRVLNKQSPIRPDRGHLHHVIERLGVRVELSTPLLYAFSFCCGGFGFLGELLGLHDDFLLAGFVILVIFYVLFVVAVNKVLDRKAAIKDTHLTTDVV